MDNQSVSLNGENIAPLNSRQGYDALKNKPPLKAWLRWLLLITQVGGGFTGVVMVLMYLVSVENASAFQVLFSLALIGLYGFVIAAGVRFALDNSRTSLLRTALWIQIPIFSSPLITWSFSAGLCINLTVIGSQFGVEYWLGSYSQFYIFSNNPWGIGVNIIAVILLILLGGRRRTSARQPETMAAQINSILQARINNTPLADLGIQILDLPGGEISIEVGSQKYPSVSSLPDGEVKAVVSSAVQEWQTQNDRQQIRERIYK